MLCVGVCRVCLFEDENETRLEARISVLIYLCSRTFSLEVLP